MRRSHALVALVALCAVAVAAGEKERRHIPLVSAESGALRRLWGARPPPTGLRMFGIILAQRLSPPASRRSARHCRSTSRPRLAVTKTLSELFEAVHKEAEKAREAMKDAREAVASAVEEAVAKRRGEDRAQGRRLQTISTGIQVGWAHRVAGRCWDPGACRVPAARDRQPAPLHHRFPACRPARHHTERPGLLRGNAGRRLARPGARPLGQLLLRLGKAGRLW